MTTINFPRHIKIASCMLLLSIILMHAPKIVELLVSNHVSVTEVDKNIYEIESSHLRLGHYILSLGKTRAICSVKSNARNIFTPSSPPGIKESISDDIPLILQKGDHKLVLNCNHTLNGFPPRLTHNPMLLPYTQGRLLSAVRYFTDVIFGTFASGFLVVMVIYLAASNQSWMNGIAFLSASAIFYSLNQSYFFRTIFDGGVSTWLHPTSKAIFTWLLFRTLSDRNKYGKMDLLMLGFPLLGLAFAYPDHAVLNSVYKVCHLFWFVVFAVQYKAFFNTTKTELSKSLVLLWTIALALDVTALANAFGPYFAPVFFGLLVFGLTIESGEIVKKKSKVFKAAQELNSIATRNDLAPISSVNAFAEVLLGATSFAGYSVYVDNALIGGTDRYRYRFCKTGFSGFQSLQSLDTLDIVDGHGSHIIRSLDKNQSIFEKGKRDKSWFIILPIGKNAAICLTSHLSREPDPSYIGLLIEAINPALQALNIRLLELTTLLNSSLARLKKTHRNGSYVLNSGAIFIDIANYSKHCENYGIAYAEFISSSLFPALIRHMDGWATPEVVRGDEIYFVVICELARSSKDIPTLTTDAILRLYSFFTQDAVGMAKESGFDIVEYRLGASTGEANLFVDDVQVRTSGEHINRAKRLQDFASKNEMLTDIQLATKEGSPFFLIEKKIIIVKKNQVEAARVGIKRAA